MDKKMDDDIKVRRELDACSRRWFDENEDALYEMLSKRIDAIEKVMAVIEKSKKKNERTNR